MYMRVDFRVYPAETKDDRGRIRFHPDNPIKLLLGDFNALSVYQYMKDNFTFGQHDVRIILLYHCLYMYIHRYSVLSKNTIMILFSRESRL